MFIECSNDQLVYMKSTMISAPHAFVGRFAGVTDDQAENAPVRTERDTPEEVEQYLDAVAALMGTDADQMVLMQQVHGATVVTISPDMPADQEELVRTDCDGTVTAQHCRPLTVRTADCVPVLLEDETAGVVAAVHCGWKSSVQDILSITLRAMTKAGAEATRVKAALGPAIGPCCFEVGTEVVEALGSYLNGETDGLVTRQPDKDGVAKYTIDLREANRRRLVQLGVPADQIDVSDECTYCKPRKYNSYRRDGAQTYSLQRSVIMLP